MSSGRRTWRNQKGDLAAHKKTRESALEREARIDKSRAARFAPRVGPPDANGRTLWTGAKGSNGYGGFWDGARVRGAHTVAWTLSNSPIPKNLVIRHQCHVPLCVNVAHMKLGTQSDNAQDMRSAGRAPRWTGRKVTDRDAVAILGYGMLGFTQAQTAAAFGISLGVVNAVRNNRAHVAGIAREVDKLYDHLDTASATPTSS